MKKSVLEKIKKLFICFLCFVISVFIGRAFYNLTISAITIDGFPEPAQPRSFAGDIDEELAANKNIIKFGRVDENYYNLQFLIEKQITEYLGSILDFSKYDEELSSYFSENISDLPRPTVDLDEIFPYWRLSDSFWMCSRVRLEDLSINDISFFQSRLDKKNFILDYDVISRIRKIVFQNMFNPIECQTVIESVDPNLLIFQSSYTYNFVENYFLDCETNQLCSDIDHAWDFIEDVKDRSALTFSKILNQKVVVF
jgi:hypothetical protein